MKQSLLIALLFCSFVMSQTSTGQSSFPKWPIRNDAKGYIMQNDECKLVDEQNLYGRSSLEAISYSSCANSFEMFFAGDFIYVKAEDCKNPEELKIALANIPEDTVIKRRKMVYDQINQAAVDKQNAINKARDVLVRSLSGSQLVIAKNFAYSMSEHVEGKGYIVEVFNATKKTIKYATISVVGINRVGDPVYERVRGSSTINLKLIGPVDPLDFGYADFEYVWFSDIVEDVKIKSAKIQYMDGSVRTVINPKTATKDEINIVYNN